MTIEMNLQTAANHFTCWGGVEGEYKLLLERTEFSHLCTRIISHSYDFLKLTELLSTPIEPESNNSEGCCLESRQCIVFHWGTFFLYNCLVALWLTLATSTRLNVHKYRFLHLTHPPPNFPWLLVIDSVWSDLFLVIRFVYNLLHLHHYMPLFSKIQTLL